MKKILPVVIALVLCVTVNAQTIYIANNNPGAPSGVNVFTGSTALQDALDAAVTNDIIHVIPGPTSYGNVIVDDKSITILGIGLNPQKNIGSRSLVGDISLNNPGASGSRISGLHFTKLRIANNNVTSYTISNLLLENCELDLVTGPQFTHTLGNMIIRNCILNASNGTGSAQAVLINTSSGVIISNNIIQGACCVHSSVQGDGLTIEHNLFYYSDNGAAFHDIDNSIVKNNIFFGTSPGLSSAETGNTFKNNLYFGGVAPPAFTDGVDGNSADASNLEGMDPLLTNMSFTSSSWDFSQDITLMPLSPALGTGDDGTDIGPSGGANPYDPEGTFLPVIQALDIPGVVTQGTDLDVNVKATGN